jgi:hypothetical protein
MSKRIDRLERAFAALDAGDAGPVEALFAPDGQWLGVPDSGFEGGTPI